ncbi:DNA polymerase III subunit alpha [Patescibacteria group bacterium]|nr:DNA polymerase III subunit alpha [Patescibacteria group bacterium]
MDPKDFVYLHAHSHYSLLEALPKPKALVARAKDLGMTALALTDNANLYGAVEFFKACKDAEIKPIIGCDIYVAPYRMTDKRPRVDDRPFRLVLIVENDEGYRNLARIVTAAYLEGFYYKARVDKQFLRDHAKGLIALSGAVGGEIATAAANGDLAKAKTLIGEYQDIFGKDNFFLELIHHPDMPRQVEVNTAFEQLAKETGAQLVATKNVFYLDPEDREGYEASMCIQRGRTLEEFRRTNTDEVDLSFGEPQEIIDGFAHLPEALLNTRKIADRVDFQMELGKNFLPHFPLPEGKTDNDVMHELCIEGLKLRYADPIPPEVMERFEFEFATIVKMGFSSYFLIVQDYITWAKKNDILVGPGRGSAAGSIIAYALQITDLDPLRYGLLFERFLNPDRVSMPDIDTDFADRGRGKVLEYVTKKYGADHVAGIITFGTLMPRAAVRDAARVLGLSFQEADVIAKVVPPPVQGKHTPLKKAIEEAPELKQLYDTDAMVRRVIELAMKMEGNPRHASQHACGIVIGDRPLVERVPLQAGQHEDMALVTQYSLNSAEAAGLVKMDFLGLSNLTIIEDALEIIRAVHKVEVDINTLPLDDKPSFALLGRGETTGVFQLESDGMKRYIKELQPSAFEDIIAMVSLYRPGPMQFIESFIRRKHGLEKVVYEHPLMENAFKETYGIPVYQEQVMQVSKDMAGFTAGEADGLRKAMGKKIAELMAKMKVKFIEGAVKNNVPEATATKIFQKLEDFAAYGFNKSHAACYALIAYRTAYLKAHYPACFMAALMNSDAGNIDRITIEVEECNRMGLKVLQPDVNESFPGFAVVKDTNNIRWGLRAIKNVGEEVAEFIVQERKAHGPFVDLADLLSRVKSHAFNRKTLEALVKCGALDRFGDRVTMAGNLDQMVQYNKQSQQEKERNQSSLFQFAPEMQVQSLELRAVEPLSKSVQLSWEKELLGMYVSEHPAALFAEPLSPFVTKLKEVLAMADGDMVRVCGIISNFKQIYTKKKNEPMAFVRLDDPSGSLETVVFPKTYQKVRDILLPDTFVLISGKVSIREREESSTKEWSVLVDEVTAFTEEQIPMLVQSLRAGGSPTFERRGAPMKREAVPVTSVQRQFVVVVPDSPSNDLIMRLRDALKAHEGETRVYLEVVAGGERKRIATEYSVSPNHALMKLVTGLVGEGNVKV